MSKSDAVKKFAEMFLNFLQEKYVDRMPLRKAEIRVLYNNIPFDDTKTYIKQVELKLFEINADVYINNDFNHEALTLLYGNFQRLLNLLSESLLDD
ncbi:hypothetical protein [Gelidibacter salicanalis]|uniref:Uncharacterized protein n=1 Tax=Gelidibacter salicanalis TaxID=291193 RepID=A0A934KXU0_9FLAO|nr:hypothetical protein [Gelidibacter salicanalis]MBJ7882308.1 hypothetical protein [Gelidibacter salicanalis]